jgi:hypothetical protein
MSLVVICINIAPGKDTPDIVGADSATPTPGSAVEFVCDGAAFDAVEPFTYVLDTVHRFDTELLASITV